MAASPRQKEIGVFVNGALLICLCLFTAEIKSKEAEWQYEDWTTVQEKEFVNYVTPGVNVNGHKLGFVKKVGECDKDILWLNWSTYKKGVETYKGREVSFQIEIDSARTSIAVDMVAAKQITPLLTAMAFTNYQAGATFIRHLEKGRRINVTVEGPKEIKKYIDIQTEEFSLNGFIANRAKAWELCKKSEKEKRIAGNALLNKEVGISPEDTLRAAIVSQDWKKKPGRYPLTHVDATIATEKSEWIVLGEDARRLYDLTEGVGEYEPDAIVIRTNGVDEGTYIIYKAYNEGYVELTDWEQSIDSVEMMALLKNGAEESNKRRKEGYPRLYIDGWIQEPYLDKEKAIIYWAILVRSDTNEVVINAEALKLGRKGFAQIKWVGDPQIFTDIETILSHPVEMLAFNEGSKYKDYVRGEDTVAALGAGALVYKFVTGKVVTKAGSGLLVVLATFAKKIWFVIFLPVIYVLIKIKEQLVKRRSERKAAQKIGEQLRRQIGQAYNRNEEETVSRFATHFVTGYMYSFIIMGFSKLGMEGEKLFEKYWREILGKLLPKRKLVEIFYRHLDELEEAKKLNREGVMELFEIGAAAGMYDATAFNLSFGIEADNLEKYLAGDEISIG